LVLGQTGNELLTLPVARFVPDRTVTEIRRLLRVSGHWQTRSTLVGYGLYGRTKYFSSGWSDPEALSATHGLRVLAGPQRKFNLGLTLRHYIECLRAL